MEGHHHKLAEEFPEFKDRIHTLKLSNQHFAKVLERWEVLDKQIARAEARIELMSEDAEEELRRTRVRLKDELYEMLRQGA
jgi:uncharacterized protein YdcH (DUF465 family)